VAVGSSVWTRHGTAREQRLSPCKRMGGCAAQWGPACTSGEVRQENEFTAAGRLPGLSDGLSAMYSSGAVLGIRGQRRSSPSRKSGSPSLASTFRGFAKAHRSQLDAALVDVAGRSLRRTWIAHWRRQYVEVLPLAQTQLGAKPPARPPRAVRQASPLELA
jgi:hypothetical protein